MYAGLPSFKNLAENLYRFFNIAKTDEQERAFTDGRYDLALELLEQHLRNNGPHPLNVAVYNELVAPSFSDAATKSHEAILKLSKHADTKHPHPSWRIVTTNFDRLFEIAAKRLDCPARVYEAPLLPIPKPSEFSGIVHLHGLLPAKRESAREPRLVMTNSSFGQAYLTERWAARFVTELFKSYTICFVGYSLDDLVLRYITDALAADKRSGDVSGCEFFAFADYKGPRNRGNTENRWRDRHVTPILFDGRDDFLLLHESLHAWADQYENHIGGKIKIVTKNANARPAAGLHKDEFVEQMLWALSDKGEVPLKTFSQLDPCPPFEWLSIFESDDEYGLGKALEGMFSNGQDCPEASRILFDWLIRFVNDSRLFFWIVSKPLFLHLRLRELIARIIYDPSENVEKDYRLIDSPDAAMRTLWRLYLLGKSQFDHSLSSPFSRFCKESEKHPDLACESAELLYEFEPKLYFQKPIVPSKITRGPRKRHRELRDLVRTNIVLHAISRRFDLYSDGAEECRFPRLVSPRFVETYQHLLEEAIWLTSVVDGPREASVAGTYSIVSIAHHDQNRYFLSWEPLVFLLRDSWLKLLEANRIRALAFARLWFGSDFVLFRRLALFAAAQKKGIPPKEWIDWLLAHKAKNLWDVYQRHEVCTLLSTANHLPASALRRLELAILAEPNNLPEKDAQTHRTRHMLTIWRFATCVVKSGANVSPDFINRAKEIQNEFPDLTGMQQDSDETRFWVRDYSGQETRLKLPREMDRLVAFLELPRASREKQYLETFPKDPFREYRDNWHALCLADPKTCLSALKIVAGHGNWPDEFWSDALSAWANKEQIDRTWPELQSALGNMPTCSFSMCLGPVARYLETAANHFRTRKQDAINHHMSPLGEETTVIVALCNRVFSVSKKLPDLHRHDPLGVSINDPVGIATEALFSCWFQEQPRMGTKIEEPYRQMFSMLADPTRKELVCGRVIMASNLVYLSHVDMEWTRNNMLPLFSWRQSSEAQPVWFGFLWRLVLSDVLLPEMKRDCLLTANAKYFKQLGITKSRYSVLLANIALRNVEKYSERELRAAFGKLPVEEGLTAVVETLENELSEERMSGEETQTASREKRWELIVRPFLQKYWPTTDIPDKQNLSLQLFRLCMAVPSKFNEIFDLTRTGFGPMSFIGFQDIKKKKLCSLFPETMLDFLTTTASSESLGFDQSHYEECLSEIVSADPSLEEDGRYLDLRRKLGPSKHS